MNVRNVSRMLVEERRQHTVNKQIPAADRSTLTNEGADMFPSSLSIPSLTGPSGSAELSVSELNTVPFMFGLAVTLPKVPSGLLLMVKSSSSTPFDEGKGISAPVVL